METPRPVLYLDFDYVLNTDAWFNSPERAVLEKELYIVRGDEALESGEKRRRAAKMVLAKADLQPDKVELVKQIIEITGCKVIVCSAWRNHFDDRELTEILAHHGLPFDGATRRNRMSEYHCIRVPAIRGHAHELPTGTRWCVLDDGVDAGDLPGHVVRPMDGMTYDHAVQVIEKLIDPTSERMPAKLEFAPLRCAWHGVRFVSTCASCQSSLRNC